MSKCYNKVIMKKKRKPKVYIPTYKIIILCASVIAVCMTLLLITTVASGNRAEKQNKKEKSTVAEKTIENNSPFFSDSDSSPAENEKSKKKSLSTQEIKPEKKNDIEPSQKSVQKDGKKTTTVTKTETSAITSESKAESSSKSTAQNTETSSKATDKSPESKSTEQKNTQATESKSVATVKVPEAEIKTVEKPSPTPEKTVPEKNTPAKTSFNFPAAVNNAQLVFVFDDGGQNLEHLKKFLALPFPITVAVLPQITHSRDSAEMVRKSGNELILHQPMQAINAKVNPGPGAITPDMTEDEIMTVLFQNINELGQIAGMNNHEGSAITADAEKMSVVLRTASENGVYFLDSRTNSESKVPYVASELGYSYYERNIFLDNTKKRADILAELTKGLGIANKNGVAIMIGHVWSADVLPDLLNEIYPELKQKGYTFTTVSKSNALKH